MADAIVTLTAEVTESYIELCDARQRQALTQQNIDIESRLVEMMKLRRAGGAATDLDVVRITNQLDTTRAMLPAIRATIAEQLNRLAALTAHAPGELDAELANAGPVPAPPATTNIGDPAALLRRRPDIRIAERQLAQHTAAVGQSVAAEFPKVSLVGTLGFFATHPEDLFNSGNFTYLAGPLLQWTPWDFGRNRARVAQANAARDEAEANYRQTVLNALADAETVARPLRPAARCSGGSGSGTRFGRGVLPSHGAALARRHRGHHRCAGRRHPAQSGGSELPAGAGPADPGLCGAAKEPGTGMGGAFG